MATDIDRLHDVVGGRVRGGKIGKTYARCHELAGTIETGEHDYIIVQITRYSDIQYIMPMLTTILKEHHIEIESTNEQRKEIVCNGKKIWFRVIDSREDENRLCGIRANYVPMRHWD